MCRVSREKYGAAKQKAADCLHRADRAAGKVNYIGIFQQRLPLEEIRALPQFAACRARQFQAGTSITRLNFRPCSLLLEIIPRLLIFSKAIRFEKKSRES